MTLTNVNRYVAEPSDFIHVLDVETGDIYRTIGHRVRDLETQETTPGTMLLEDAMTLILHMDKTDQELPTSFED